MLLGKRSLAPLHCVIVHRETYRRDIIRRSRRMEGTVLSLHKLLDVLQVLSKVCSEGVAVDCWAGLRLLAKLATGGALIVVVLIDHFLRDANTLSKVWK